MNTIFLRVANEANCSQSSISTSCDSAWFLMQSPASPACQIQLREEARHPSTAGVWNISRFIDEKHGLIWTRLSSSLLKLPDLLYTLILSECSLQCSTEWHTAQWSPCAVWDDPQASLVLSSCGSKSSDQTECCQVSDYFHWQRVKFIFFGQCTALWNCRWRKRKRPMLT